ncbi:MAG: LysR family transcriptional regulator [Alphaproteobacteria bacterium]|nr:LysR family transcriptional regulator [Alphaproteobacteria bacterium]
MKADWDDIRVYLAVAREGSLTKAATALAISQPTAGRRLKRLEEALETVLFDRLPDGYALTAAGEALLAKAEQMEMAAFALDAEASGLAPDVEGTVRVSVDDNISLILSPMLPAIQRRLPQIEIELSISHYFASLARREAEVLIRDRAPDNQNLIVRKWLDLEYAVYGAPSYIEANPTALTEDRYRDCAWIGYDSIHQYFAGGEWLARRLGNKAPALRHNDAALSGTLAADGAGLAVLPCILGDQNPALRRVTDPIPELARSANLYVHPDIRKVPAVRAMIDALVETVRARHPGSDAAAAIDLETDAG